MLDKSPADLTIRAWSKGKLDLLAKYIQAYSTIMTAQRRKNGWPQSYSYIDAFSCVGRFVDELGNEVDGSPIVALKCEPPFDDFWFIELQEQRLSTLLSRSQRDFPGRRILPMCGDANTIIRDQITPSFLKASGRHAFIFLDPYGLQIEFETVRRLAQAGTFDIFINFSTMGITRLLRRRSLPEPWATDLIQRVMGDASWITDLYEREVDLFDNVHHRRRVIDAEVIAGLYAERLEPLSLFISRPLVMRNTRNAPLYALLLASHNENAVGIFEDISDGQYRPRPEQPRLF